MTSFLIVGTGDWQTIFIPFSDFVGVTRAKTDPSAPPLNPSKIRQIGFRLSRFDFNNLTNPSYRPGPFRLEVRPVHELPLNKQQYQSRSGEVNS